jgi:hypothetical protein
MPAGIGEDRAMTDLDPRQRKIASSLSALNMRSGQMRSRSLSAAAMRSRTPASLSA